MHIPEGVLSGAVCPLTMAGGAALLGSALYKIKKSKTNPDVNKFAFVTAFIFAAQMINYPVLQGVSGHLIGGLFAAFMLGAAPAVLSLSLVLIVQSLVFQDGGVLSLGANIITMAGVCQVFGGVLLKKIGKKDDYRYIKYFLITSFLVFAAALLCGAFVAVGKNDPLSIMWMMTKGHISAAFMEGAITTGMIFLYEKGYMENLRAMALIFLVIAIAPIASSLPDGLTYVLELSSITESLGLVSSPMPDYSFTMVGNEIISLYIAAITGVVGLIAVSKLGYNKIK